MFKELIHLSTLTLFCNGNTDGMSRIINGIDAKQKDWYFFAQIYYKPKNSVKFEPSCGGVIVSEWHILTAAHCLFDKELRKPEDIVISAGGTKIARFLEIRNKQLPVSNWGISYRFVHSTTIHPEYDDGKASNDIGILRITERLVFA